MREWKFDSPGDEWGGVLFVREGHGDWRPLIQLDPMEPGHCIDTGNLIAVLLNLYEKAQHTGSIGAVAEPEGRSA